MGPQNKFGQRLPKTIGIASGHITMHSHDIIKSFTILGKRFLLVTRDGCVIVLVLLYINLSNSTLPP